MSLLPEISQASAEINKLVAQANIHQTIARVDPAAFTDPADTMLLASRDPVIREVSVGMTGVEAAPYTVSGTPPLSLPNSLGKPLKAWSVDVLPYQEGSGDPAPDNVRPIHGTNQISFVTAGDNLLVHDFLQGSAILLTDYNRITASTLIPIEQGKTYTFSASDYTNYFYVLNSGQNNRLPFPYSPPVSYQWCGHNVSWVQHDITFTATRSGYLTVVVHNAANNAIRPSDVSDVKMKFEVSASSTPWTENATYVSVTLPQTVYTGTIGSEGGESRDAVYDMGDLNWIKSGSGDGRFFSGPLSTKYAAGQFEFMCEQYKPDGVGAPNNYYGADGTIRYWLRADSTFTAEFYVVDTRYNTAAEFKAAVAGIKIVCPAQNTSQFSIASPTIPTPTGTATTWATAEDGTVNSMEVTYVGKA